MFITESIKHIGVNDHQIDLFEGQYIVPNGMAYNSYVILDEKIAVIDTVDVKFGDLWLEKMQDILAGKKPDYLVILHMEPDHSANIKRFLEAYPDTIVVGNSKTFKMINQFFELNLDHQKIEINEGDILNLGNHKLHFVFAPMVHWPEVMVAYDSYEKVLFSADAFGKFGALDKKEDWLDEARRYYIGIVGKYGPQVQTLLAKASQLDIKIICSLHGPILSENLDYYLGHYDKWSKYEAETDGVAVFYTSIYGHTKEAVMYLVDTLKKRGIKNYEVIDLARSDMHYAVSKAFQYNRLVLATTTYNNGIFPKMNDFINRLIERNFQNRTIGIIENGSWNPTAAKTIIAKFVDSDNIFFIPDMVTIHSSMKEDNKKEIRKLVDELTIEKRNDQKMDLKALKKLEYGLFVVTTNDGVKDNGAIVNTVMQLTSEPTTVAVSINQANYSHDVVLKSKKMNVCILDKSTPFSVIEKFGFKSGRDVNKFEGEKVNKSSNGLVYLDKHSNAYLSLEVMDIIDLGTHSLFICNVVESVQLNNNESVSYSYYLEHIKPQPNKTQTKGYVCTICGYVYEGEEIPDDYVCPLCLHGKEYFEPLE